MTIEIIDLNSRSNDSFKSDIPQQLRDGLSRPPGHKRIPTILLYDERGLKLFDDMTTKAPEYYIFPAEEEILKNGADDIIRTMHGENRISSNEVVVELGAGLVLTVMRYTRFPVPYSTSLDIYNFSNLYLTGLCGKPLTCY